MNDQENRRRSLLVLVGACVLAAALGVGAALAFTGGSDSPGDDSPEAGFARDMQVHHAQAVEMATIIRDQTSDRTIRTLAYDILTSQQQQIGQMYAWLRGWGLSQTSDRTPMVWMAGMHHDGMPDDGHGMAMSLLPDGRMPGMASATELEELRTQDGQAAEIQFLQLMIVHHRAGVMMAQAALDLCEDELVLELARGMAAAQTAEIRTMNDLLADRATVPE